jgi:MFS family permease
MKSMKVNSPRSVVAVALITAACLTGDSMLYIVLPTHWETAGLDSLWEVGILLSVNRFIRLPLTPLIGWTYAHIGVRTGVFIAVALTGVLTVGYGVVHSFAGWLLLRCLWGIAWTFLRMGAYLMILDCADESCCGALFGRYNGLFRLGSLVGMLAGGVIGDIWGLLAAAFIFGVGAISTLPLTIWYVPSICVTQKETEPVWQRLGRMHDLFIYRALITGMIIAMAFQGVVASSLSHLIRSNWGTSITLGVGLVGAASLAGALQALRWSWEPWLAPWFGRISDGQASRGTMLAFILLLGALLLAILPLHLSFGVWLVTVIGMQLTATALTTIGDAAAADAAVNQSRTTVMTLYVMATDIGAALGPFLGYIMAELWGVGSMYWSAAALLAALGVWWLWGKRGAPSIA